MSTIDFGRKILAAVDLRGDWCGVVAHAVDFARFGGATVHLVHVIEKPAAALRRGLTAKALRHHRARLRAEAQERLDAAVESVRVQGIKCLASVVDGQPAREILARAREFGAGLIVGGAGVTEGREWLFVGTTADRLVRNSPIPVLIAGPAAPGRLRRLLVPTDLDRPDQGAVRLAAQLAGARGGRVTVLHVFAEPSLASFRMGDVAALRRELRDKSREAFATFMAGLTLPPGTRPPHQLLVASEERVQAAETIVAEAARLNMDLIVMALGGVSFLHYFVIGSTAERVLRRLPCSFLALPTAWARRR